MTTRPIAAAILLATSGAASAPLQFTTDARLYGGQILRCWWGVDGIDPTNEILSYEYYFPDDIPDFQSIDQTVNLEQTDTGGQRWAATVSHGSDFTATTLIGGSAFRVETSANNIPCDQFNEVYYAILDADSDIGATFAVSAPCRVRVDAELYEATEDVDLVVELRHSNGPTDPIPRRALNTAGETRLEREIFFPEPGVYGWHSGTAARLWCATPGTVTSGSWASSFELLPDCNAADYAAPHGVLDFEDVNDFVSLFSAKAPEADLAAPHGVLDLADLAAFVNAFLDGCP